MKAIKCKSGNTFAWCNEDFIDAEWILQEAYYKAQGCSIESVEVVTFSKCECDHCRSLEHNFEELVEEIRNEF